MEIRWNKRDWFKPQWEASSPIVMNHQGGDFMECKVCYNGSGVLPTPVPENMPTPHQLMTLSTQCLIKAQRMRVITEFLREWLATPSLISFFKGKGGVTVEVSTDPRQWSIRGTLGVNGASAAHRWCFDPRNRNYEKAFHLAWPDLVEQRNKVTLGDILESILGVRDEADKQHRPIPGCAIAVCRELSSFVNSVYQLTQYSNTEHVCVHEWLTYVQRNVDHVIE